MNNELQWVEYPCTIIGATYWHQKQRLSLLARNSQGETLDIFAGKSRGESPLERQIKELVGPNPTEDHLKIIAKTLQDLYNEGKIVVKAAQAINEQGEPFLLIRMMRPGGQRVLL